MDRESEEPDECSICGTPSTETNLGWSEELEVLTCVDCLFNRVGDEYRIPLSESESEEDASRSWCPRCGERIKEHASATVDDEERWICPVEERAVEDENPQEQLGAFGVSDDSTENKEDSDR